MLGDGPLLDEVKRTIAAHHLEREIGTVGGDSLYGLPLADLTKAWQAETDLPEITLEKQ